MKSCFIAQLSESRYKVAIDFFHTEKKKEGYPPLTLINLQIFRGCPPLTFISLQVFRGVTTSHFHQKEIYIYEVNY